MEFQLKFKVLKAVGKKEERVAINLRQSYNTRNIDNRFEKETVSKDAEEEEAKGKMIGCNQVRDTDQFCPSKMVATLGNWETLLNSPTRKMRRQLTILRTLKEIMII